MNSVKQLAEEDFHKELAVGFSLWNQIDVGQIRVVYV